MNLNEYENLIKITARDYDFRKIDHGLNICEIKNSQEQIALLRHDIDFSPSSALAIAQVEHDLGIVSTFTVLLSGRYYNPFELETKKLLKKIASYGHSIGLHFDPKCYDVRAEDALNRHIETEANILRNLLNLDIEMFSFHNTDEFSLSCRSEYYGGLINVYSDQFRDNIDYTSDSNGYWRFRSWLELLKERRPFIQILTHPLWWQDKNDLPPFETVLKCVFEKSFSTINDYSLNFDGQNIRLNKSYLTEWLIELNSENLPTLHNNYAQFLFEKQAFLDKHSDSYEDFICSLADVYMNKYQIIDK